MVYTIWYIPYGIYQLTYGIYHSKVVHTMRQPSIWPRIPTRTPSRNLKPYQWLHLSASGPGPGAASSRPRPLTVIRTRFLSLASFLSHWHAPQPGPGAGGSSTDSESDSQPGSRSESRVTVMECHSPVAGRLALALRCHVGHRCNLIQYASQYHQARAILTVS
jgi:hypothetical protein